MAENTGIQWTQHSWNPWRGCTKISPGCAHCYMFTEQKRYGRDPSEVVRTKTWGDPLRWNKAAAANGVNEMVFTCSWSDWFHEAADLWREEAWAVIKATPNLTYQILTKRPENIATRLPADWGAGYPNCWLGVSAENRKYWLERVPLLRRTPAAVRFVSAEPLLGDIGDVSGDLHTGRCQSVSNQGLHCGLEAKHDGSHCALIESGAPWFGGPRIDWVIVGGESGPGARPCDMDWIRSIVQQCKSASVPAFVKQVGSVPVYGCHQFNAREIYPTIWGPIKDSKGGKMEEWPQDLRVREFPTLTRSTHAH